MGLQHRSPPSSATEVMCFLCSKQRDGSDSVLEPMLSNAFRWPSSNQTPGTRCTRNRSACFKGCTLYRASLPGKSSHAYRRPARACSLRITQFSAAQSSFQTRNDGMGLVYSLRDPQSGSGHDLNCLYANRKLSSVHAASSASRMTLPSFFSTRQVSSAGSCGGAAFSVSTIDSSPAAELSCECSTNLCTSSGGRDGTALSSPV